MEWKIFGMVWKISGMEWNCIEDFACYGRFTFHSIVCPGYLWEHTLYSIYVWNACYFSCPIHYGSPIL